MQRALLFALAPCAVVLACSTDDPVPAPAAPDAALVARFTAHEGLPPLFDVPFPSDLYRSDDGRGFVDPLPGLDTILKRNARFVSYELARTNGWSRIAPALFALDTVGPDGSLTAADLDDATLPFDEAACASEGSSVILLDLETRTRVPCRATRVRERDRGLGMDFLAVGPARGLVLAEGRRYAAVLTSRVRDRRGRPLSAPPAFHEAMGGRGPLGAFYGAVGDEVLAIVGGTLGDDAVVAVAPYTTQRTTDELYALRDAAAARSAPVLSRDPTAMAPMGTATFAAVDEGGALPAGFTASLDDYFGVVAPEARLPPPSVDDDPDETLPVRAHNAIGAVGNAVFIAPNYLVDHGAYDEPGQSTFARDASGAVVPAPDRPTAKIWVTVALPRAPMPTGGYPVVVVQHGFGGSRAYMFSQANWFASRGWAVVAIDNLTLGARAVDPRLHVDATTDYTSAPGSAYDGPDGIADFVNGRRADPLHFFGLLLNLGAMRDQFRQFAMDATELVRVVRGDPDLSWLQTGGAVPRFDPTRVAFFGDSMGAVQGALIAAIEPSVRAWVLNAAAGGLFTELASHSPTIGTLLGAAAINFAATGGVLSEAHPLVVFAQTVAESGDPIAYAAHLVTSPRPLAGAPTPPRNVFQVAILYDELCPNESNEALARAGGWALARPNVGANSGVADLRGSIPYRGGGIALAEVEPDATGALRDTPRPGVTAAMVQISPAQHGTNSSRVLSHRSFAIPYNTADGAPSAVSVPAYPVRSPHREFHAAMQRFFAEAFAGNTPSIAGLPAPVRDVDGDGVADGAAP